MKTSHETTTLINDLSARCPVLQDLPSTETFCVVATQPGKQGRGHFIYATAQTHSGAAMMANGLRERGTSNKQGYLRPCTKVRVVKLDTPTYRAADYMMTESERETALEIARIF